MIQKTKESSLQLSIFCEGQNIDFSVADKDAAVFISSTKEFLKTDEYADSVYGHKKYTDEELSQLSANEILKIAYGSLDYNNWHKHKRHADGRPFEDNSEIIKKLVDNITPEDVIIASDEKKAVKDFIDRTLPASQADVYYLRVIEGLEFHEIAGLLKDNTTNVSHRFYRAEKQMQKFAKKYKTPSKFISDSGYFSEPKKVSKEK